MMKASTCPSRSTSTAYGERTKKSGIARLDPGQTAAELLMWEDASFGNLTKAEDADTYVYTRQTNTDFPDYYVAEGTLSNATRLSDANPQQADVRWSDGSILIDYVSDKGARLQGALHLPANYEEGKSYPTIVFIYEKRSQNLEPLCPAPSPTASISPCTRARGTRCWSRISPTR